MTRSDKTPQKILSITNIKVMLFKLFRYLILNYIIVGGTDSVTKNSCDYIIFIDDVKGKDSIGERYILHSLLQGCSQLKNSKICVVTSKKLTFIPEMFSRVSKIILIEKITRIQPVGAIASVYVSSGSNLLRRVIANIRIALKGLILRTIHLVHREEYNNDTVINRELLERRKKRELLYYSTLVPVKLKEFLYSPPDRLNHSSFRDVFLTFSNLGLQRDKVILIFPEIRGGWDGMGGYKLPSNIFESLIKMTKRIGFKYIINSKDRSICENYGNCLYLPLDKISEFAELCGHIVSVRVGAVDFLSFTKTKKMIFYPYKLLDWYLIDRDLTMNNNLLQVIINKDGLIDKTEDQILNFLLRSGVANVLV